MTQEFPDWRFRAYPVTKGEAQTIAASIIGAILCFCLATAIAIALFFGGQPFYGLAVPGIITSTAGIYFLVSIWRMWANIKKETAFEIPEPPK